MTQFLLTDCFIVVYARFLQHFALSSIGQEPILYDHLGVLFPSAELRNPASSQGDKVSMLNKVKLILFISMLVVPSKILLSLLSIAETIQIWRGLFIVCKVVITVITGLPGSHKKRLCDFLVQLNKERGRWERFYPLHFFF